MLIQYVRSITFAKTAAVSRMKIQPDTISIKEYDYLLPHERIAEFPLERRDQSKLLIYKNGKITDDRFYSIAQYLPDNALIIVNDTRVIEARILFQKPTGGVIEIFCLEPFEQPIEQALHSKGKVLWKCLIGGASKWKPGQLLEKQVIINGQQETVHARYIDKEKDNFIIELSWEPDSISFIDVLHAAGAIPLPPYIKRSATPEDAVRYQTMFGKFEGSVAAPTAALHFTSEVLEDLKKKHIDVDYITLHVGAGTFKPVKAETIAGHEMHREPFTIHKETLIKLIEAKHVITVGTTSLRTVESIYWLGVKELHGLNNNSYELGQWEAYDLAGNFTPVDYKESLKALINVMAGQQTDVLHCQTSLIIVPGYEFKIPSALITNFHQPQSTLLLLVSAFIGEDWKKVYQHAMENNYRFLSYGDSSLLTPGP